MRVSKKQLYRFSLNAIYKLLLNGFLNILVVLCREIYENPKFGSPNYYNLMQIQLLLCPLSKSGPKKFEKGGFNISCDGTLD